MSGPLTALPASEWGKRTGRAWLDGMKQAAGVETDEELHAWLTRYIGDVGRMLDEDLRRGLGDGGQRSEA